ncbi:MAG: FAD-dependent oxidoreductase [Actinomycetota bacterium]|nr:FAD-dependent oxidoreductase [Actinomycetota bacterium]
MSATETEVLIIGAGVLGAAAARELSKYKVDVTVVEKAVDVGWGCTKANVGVVNQGRDTLEFRPEYHRSYLLWRSLKLMGPLCKELEVPFEKVGGWLMAWNMGHKEKLDKCIKRTAGLGLGEDEFHWYEELRETEPHISDKILGGLFDPEIAVVNPVFFTQALMENATANGVKLMLETEVLDIEAGHSMFTVQTSQEEIKARYVINAAGEYIDKIAAMVDADDFVLFPIKGYVGVMDRSSEGLVKSLIAAIEDELGEMNVVVPTVEGNVLFGIQLQINRRGDYSTTEEMATKALQNAQRLVPDISGKDVINAFCGFLMFRNFEIGWHECEVGLSDRVPRFINMTIGYPGVSASTGAAAEVVEVLEKDGLKLEPDPGFEPRREAIPDFSKLSERKQRELVKKDPRYGHVVCRCETVTEGEIVEAIRRGATTLDGVKHRVRAGMGRCQAGFCGPRVTRILARELGIPETDVTKKGPESPQLEYRTKQILEEGGKHA